MSLTINAPLTTNDGGSVASGAHVIFETNFPARGFDFNVNMEVYRNKQAYTDGLRPIRGIQDIPSLNFQEELSAQDFTGLTPSVVHEKVKVYLEDYIGSGNVSINSIG